MERVSDSASLGSGGGDGTVKAGRMWTERFSPEDSVVVSLCVYGNG